jgi:hypothetical protein
MEHSDIFAKSALVLFIALILLPVFHENLEGISVSNNTRSSSQYHVNTSDPLSMSGEDLKLQNTTGMVSLVGHVNVKQFTGTQIQAFCIHWFDCIFSNQRLCGL